MAVLRNFRSSINRFTNVGTLAQVSIGADAPRDLLDNVEAADWAPDGNALAAVHVVNGQSRIEYPIGKVLYETAGWISHLRFSPKGDRLAFIDHNLLGDDGGTISVVDLNGKKSLGLLGMHERALLFGGEVKITGAPGQGTRVAVAIPLGAPKEAKAP